MPKRCSARWEHVGGEFRRSAPGRCANAAGSTSIPLVRNRQILLLVGTVRDDLLRL